MTIIMMVVSVIDDASLTFVCVFKVQMKANLFEEGQMQQMLDQVLMEMHPCMHQEPSFQTYPSWKACN